MRQHAVSLGVRVTLVQLMMGVWVGGCFDLDGLREPNQSFSDAGAFGGSVDSAVVGGSSDASDMEPMKEADAGDNGQGTDTGLRRDGGGSTCGALSQPCCRPDNSCTDGVCLRGVCAAFGGAHATTAACAPRCRVRNAYTAGCSCPFGFVEQSIGVTVRLCDGVSVGPGELALCLPPKPPEKADVGGAFLQASCSSACVQPDPRTGTCACPSGTVPRSVDIGASTPCAEDRGRLTFCEYSGQRAATFAGVWQTIDDRCKHPNPATGECSCPAGAIDHSVELPPMTFHLCLW